MIQMHQLKIHRRFADAKLDGDKLFEVRDNDRYFQKGDLIQYTVINNPEGPLLASATPNHPLNEMIFEITYVYSGPGVENGYVVLGERDVTSDYINREGKFEGLQTMDFTKEQG